MSVCKKKKELYAPIFEVRPKIYVYGKRALEIAQAADRAGERYQVSVIFTAQYTDIRMIADKTNHLMVFAQHMDYLYPGRGVGAVLPEALKEAGAEGVLLNHSECPMDMDSIRKCMLRAKEVGLYTMVCAENMDMAACIARMEPDIILYEAPDMIEAEEEEQHPIEEIASVNERIAGIDPRIIVLHGAGIHDERDIYKIVKAGADATGSTSGIMKSEKPCEVTEKMIRAVSDAWKERNAGKHSAVG